MGAFGYADDLKVLCPSIGGLQKMINICENFGVEYDVNFNAKKTIGICYGDLNSNEIRSVYLNGVAIKWHSVVKYLGNLLSHDLSDAADVKLKKGSFIAAVNKLNYTFQSADSFIRIKLLQTYCTAWYGCQSWLLGSAEVKTLDIEWRKAVRRTLGLPARTRTALLPDLAGSSPFSQQHRSRVSKFLKTLKECNNDIVNFLYKRAEYNTIGPLGKNITYLRVCPPVDQGHPSDLLDARITHIRELIRMRDGFDQTDVLNQEELHDILEYVCIS